jgi:hypothetical protein
MNNSPPPTETLVERPGLLFRAKRAIRCTRHPRYSAAYLMQYSDEWPHEEYSEPGLANQGWMAVDL